MSSSARQSCGWMAGLWLVACAPAALADGCRLQKIAEVPMTTLKRGQVVVPVEVNGLHVKMAIDTTSSVTNIYSSAMAGLSVKPVANLRSGVVRVGNKNLTQTVDVGKIRLGSVQWPQVNALVYPLERQYPPLLGEDDVVGSLGLNMFLKVDVELDFAAGKFRLFSQEHCPGKVVYWTTQYDVLPLQKDRIGDPYITMTANGTPMEANLATMSPLSAMEEAAAKKFLGLDRATAGIDADAGSDGCAFCSSIDFKAQGLEIRHARVRMVSTIPADCHLFGPSFGGKGAKYDCGGAFPLHVGINVLSQLRLYFANGEKKLYFTPATAGSDAAAAAATEATAPTAP